MPETESRATIFLQFEAVDEQESAEVAHQIEEQLRRTEEVEEVKDIEAEISRFGMVEAVVLITGAVTIAKQGSELVEALRKLVKSLTGLVQDVNGLKKAFVEVGMRRVPVTELTEDDLQELASASE